MNDNQSPIIHTISPRSAPLVLPPCDESRGGLTSGQSPPTPRRTKNKKLRIFFKGVGWISYGYSIFHKGVIGEFYRFL